MKWFYVISLLIVGLLAASPFVLLPKPEQGRFAGKVVSYNTYGAKVKSVDPATSGDTTSAAMQGNVFEGLYAYHYLKRPVEVIPLLAAALPTVSPDALTYTIPLKKGVEYAPNPCFGLDDSNHPMTRTVRAEDFVLAFKRIADYHLTTKLSLVTKGGGQIRHNALEAARISTNKALEGELGRGGMRRIVNHYHAAGKWVTVLNTLISLISNM